MLMQQLALCSAVMGIAHRPGPVVLRPSTLRARLSSNLQMVNVGDQIIAGNDWNSSSPAYGIVRAQSCEDAGPRA
jgi:hypothetical protein